MIWIGAPYAGPELTYKPEEFRSIRVEVDDDSLTVRTIRGYYPGR